MNGWEIALTILIPVLGILTTIFAVEWHKSATLARESGEFLIGIADSMEDGDITRSELKEIVQDAAEVVAAGKALFMR